MWWIEKQKVTHFWWKLAKNLCQWYLYINTCISSCGLVLQKLIFGSLNNMYCRKLLFKLRIAVELKTCVIVCLFLCVCVWLWMLIPVWEVAYDNDTLQLCEAGERWAFPRLHGQQRGHPVVYRDGKVQWSLCVS